MGMKQKLYKYFLVLAGIFVLAHIFVPHHHHVDDIFVEFDNHEHHSSAEIIDEQVIFSALVQQDEVWRGAVCVHNFVEPVRSCWQSFVTKVPVTTEYYSFNLVYRTFVYHSKGLRAPPVSIC